MLVRSLVGELKSHIPQGDYNQSPAGDNEDPPRATAET